MAVLELGAAPVADLERAGFRLGARGTHTSRTIMLNDLGELLAAVPADGDRSIYAQAVIEDNVLGKQTAATRRLSYQRLRELYGLDPRIPLFRVLRRLWRVDRPGRPRLAVLTAMARDPLLTATASVVVRLEPGQEMMRSTVLARLRGTVDDRLNDAVLEKVARNTASSWAQAGFLQGRVRKVRCRVEPTPGAVSLALWLGRLEGYAVARLLDSPWARVAGDGGPLELLPLALKASQLGLIRARSAAGVLSIDPTRGTGHGWTLVDCTSWFADWMARDEYRDAYFEDPSLLELKLESEFRAESAQKLAIALEQAGESDVVALLGVASLYGFLRVSDLIRAAEPAIRGRLVVFFPGSRNENNFRLLDARDGWNYLAQAITLHDEQVNLP